MQKTIQPTSRAIVTSSIKAVSELIGAYDDVSIMALAAPSMAGKTTLGLTLAYEYSAITGRNACIFDTEGGAKRFVEKWDKRLKERFPKAKTPLVYLCRNYKAILKAHGRILFEKYSDSGKLTVNLKHTIEEGKRYRDDLTNKIIKTPAPDFIQFIRDNDIGFVIYDSFTMPFSSEIPPSVENNPAKNFIQNLWHRCIIDLVIDKEGCFVMTLHHMSKNPMEPQAEESMTGGKSVRHNSKVILYMKKFEAFGAKTYRKLQLARYYDKPAMTEQRYLNLTDRGYVDATEDQMESAKTAAKQARKK